MFDRCSLCLQRLFHNNYSPIFLFSFVPKTGHGFATQNLKSRPTAAGGAVKADRSEARNALHSTSRPTAVFSCARLVASFILDDLDGLQLQHPRAVLKLVARVDRRVIGRLVADHGGDDFEPAHS